MTTWHSGVEAMVRRLATMTEPPERFLERLEAKRIPRVPGSAIFLTRIAEAIPPLMILHVSQIGALPQTVIGLTVKFTEVPRVSLSNRLKLVHVFEGFWHLTVHYGFVEIPDLPSALHTVKNLGCPIDFDTAVYFGAHDEVLRGQPGRRLLRCHSSPSCSATRCGQSICSTFRHPIFWNLGARSRSRPAIIRLDATEPKIGRDADRLSMILKTERPRNSGAF
jgi:K+ transporter